MTEMNMEHILSQLKKLGVTEITPGEKLMAKIMTKKNYSTEEVAKEILSHRKISEEERSHLITMIAKSMRTEK